MYRQLCSKGIAFLESNEKYKTFSFLYCDEKVPKENQLEGFVSVDYSVRVLKEIKPSEYLSDKTTEKEKKISEFFVAQKDENGYVLLDTLEEEQQKKEQANDTETRLQALNILVPLISLKKFLK